MQHAVRSWMCQEAQRVATLATVRIVCGGLCRTELAVQRRTMPRAVDDMLRVPTLATGTIVLNVYWTFTRMVDPGALAAGVHVTVTVGLRPIALPWTYARTAASVVVRPLSDPRTAAHLVPSRAALASTP